MSSIENLNTYHILSAKIASGVDQVGDKDFSCSIDDNGTDICEELAGSRQNPFKSMSQNSLPIRDFARISGAVFGTPGRASKSQVVKLADQLKSIIAKFSTSNFIEFSVLEKLKNDKKITPELYDAANIVAQYGETEKEKYITDEEIDALAKAVNIDIDRVGKGKPVDVRGTVRGGSRFPRELPKPAVSPPSNSNKGF